MMPGGFDGYESDEPAATTTTSMPNSSVFAPSLRTNKKERLLRVNYSAPNNPKLAAMSEGPTGPSNVERLRNWDWSDEFAHIKPATRPMGRAGLKAKARAASNKALAEQALANRALEMQARASRTSASGSGVATPPVMSNVVEQPAAAHTPSVHSNRRSAYSRSSNANPGSRPASQPAQEVGRPNVIDFADRFPAPAPYAGNVSFSTTNRRRKGCLRSLFCCR